MHFCADEARAIVMVATAALPIVPRVRRFLKELAVNAVDFFWCCLFHPVIGVWMQRCPCSSCKARRHGQRELEAERMREWLRTVAPRFIRRMP